MMASLCSAVVAMSSHNLPDLSPLDLTASAPDRVRHASTSTLMQEELCASAKFCAAVDGKAEPTEGALNVLVLGEGALEQQGSDTRLLSLMKSLKHLGNAKVCNVRSTPGLLHNMSCSRSRIHMI